MSGEFYSQMHALLMRCQVLLVLVRGFHSHVNFYGADMMLESQIPGHKACCAIALKNERPAIMIVVTTVVVLPEFRAARMNFVNQLN